MATSSIREAAAGDAIAFARIVDAYHGDMIRVAYVVSGGSQELADDAVQAAWTIAWRKLGSVRDPSRLKAWLVSGQEMMSTGTMTDPRVNGTSLVTMNADFYQNVASEWGTTRTENAAGAWEGPWTGASWNDGATAVSGWLVGSGAYEGYTYYFHGYGSSQPYQMEGIIFEGSPPTP